MDKKLAIDLLGGTPAKAALLLGVTPSAISQWPEELPRRLADRVLGAAVRNGIDVQLRMSELVADEHPASVVAEEARDAA